MKRLGLTIVIILGSLALSQPALASQHVGKLTMLRVHDVGTGYGPTTAFLDVEVVVRIDAEPKEAYGFQLRSDKNSLVRQGMLDLLRDAFKNDWKVTFDENKGVIFRVWLAK